VPTSCYRQWDRSLPCSRLCHEARPSEPRCLSSKYNFLKLDLEAQYRQAMEDRARFICKMSVRLYRLFCLARCILKYLRNAFLLPLYGFNSSRESPALFYISGTFTFIGKNLTHVFHSQKLDSTCRYVSTTRSSMSSERFSFA
jgi:hypothetical protein